MVKNKKTKVVLTPEQQEFITFLKSKRLYSAYLRNIAKDVEYKCIDRFFREQKNPSEWVSDAFVWKLDTGKDMENNWSILNKEWETICNEKAKS